MKAYNYAALKTFTKSQIGGLTKKLSSFRFGSQDRSDSKYKLMEDIGLVRQEYNSDCEGYVYLFKAPRKITREQTKFGQQWLKDWFYKKDGTTRGGKRTEFISSRVLSLANKVTRFEFIGVIGLCNRMGEEIQFIPLYRAFTKTGQYFDYAPIHWGMPVVIEHLGAIDSKPIKNRTRERLNPPIETTQPILKLVR